VTFHTQSQFADSAIRILGENHLCAIGKRASCLTPRPFSAARMGRGGLLTCCDGKPLADPDRNSKRTIHRCSATTARRPMWGALNGREDRRGGVRAEEEREGDEDTASSNFEYRILP
jgi:hypothetical protein